MKKFKGYEGFCKVLYIIGRSEFRVTLEQSVKVSLTLLHLIAVCHIFLYFSSRFDQFIKSIAPFPWLVI